MAMEPRGGQGLTASAGEAAGQDGACEVSESNTVPAAQSAFAQVDRKEQAQHSPATGSDESQHYESKDEDVNTKTWRKEDINVGGVSCTFEGNFEGGSPSGFGRAHWDAIGCAYVGQFKHGDVHGAGTFIGEDGSRIRGIFRRGILKQEGVRTTREGKREMVVSHEPVHVTRRGGFQVVGRAPTEVIAEERRVTAAAVMKMNSMHEGSCFGHIRTMEGKIKFAVPYRAHRPLSNADLCQGKIVVVQRGGCTIAEKVKQVQTAGATAMILVGMDNEDRFSEIMQIREVPEQGFLASIPVVYVLGKDEAQLSEGMICRIVFLPRTPRTPLTWSLGQIIVPPQTCYADDSQANQDELLSHFIEMRKADMDEVNRRLELINQTPPLPAVCAKYLARGRPEESSAIWDAIRGSM
eukprot:765112-Hanusia_phi.AAC.4